MLVKLTSDLLKFSQIVPITLLLSQSYKNKFCPKLHCIFYYLYIMHLFHSNGSLIVIDSSNNFFKQIRDKITFIGLSPDV
jgi:hypothetical protein